MCFLDYFIVILNYCLHDIQLLVILLQIVLNTAQNSIESLPRQHKQPAVTRCTHRQRSLAVVNDGNLTKVAPLPQHSNRLHFTILSRLETFASASLNYEEFVADLTFAEHKLILGESHLG